VEPLLQRTTNNWIRRFLWLVSRVLWGVRSHGGASVPRKGPVLLAVTHSSVLDPILVGTSVRRWVRYLARDTLFGPRGTVKLHGRVLRFVGAVPIRRDGGGARDTLRAASELLHAGHVVLIFPEGTRSPDGGLQRFRRGVGLIARATGCPVVPVSIQGAHSLWPKGRRIPRVFGGPVRVAFGEPVTYDETTSAEDVATDLRSRILALRGETAGDGADSAG